VGGDGLGSRSRRIPMGGGILTSRFSVSQKLKCDSSRLVHSAALAAVRQLMRLGIDLDLRTTTLMIPNAEHR
jgi:hypothetical protein